MKVVRLGKIIAAMALAAVACDGERPETSPDDDAGTETLDAGRTTDAGPVRSPDSGSADDARVAMDAGRSSDAGDSSDATTSDAAETCLELPATGSITVAGELLSTSTVWNRPSTDTCPTELELSETYYVETLVFCNRGGSGTFTIKMQGDEHPPLTLDDPYLTIYVGTEIAGDPKLCLAVNDDLTGDSADSEVRITLPDGEFITVAASQYNEIGGGSELGTYQLVIQRR